MIYSFKASGDYAPTFVSENIKRLLGYCPDEYLKNADFWRARVHPDDIEFVEAEQALLFERDRHTAEYRFRKKDDHYCWVSDEQHLVRDENGAPFEIVGSWSDITDRKNAEAAENAARGRLSALLETAPVQRQSFQQAPELWPVSDADRANIDSLFVLKRRKLVLIDSRRAKTPPTKRKIPRGCATILSAIRLRYRTQGCPQSEAQMLATDGMTDTFESRELALSEPTAETLCQSKVLGRF